MGEYEIHSKGFIHGDVVIAGQYHFGQASYPP